MASSVKCTKMFYIVSIYTKKNNGQSGQLPTFLFFSISQVKLVYCLCDGDCKSSLDCYYK